MAHHPNEVSVRVKASLRIFGDTIDPEVISMKFGFSGDHQHRTGDPIGSRSDHIYKHNMWILHSKSDPSASLETHLNELLSRVEPMRSYLNTLAQHATVDFYCVIFWDVGFQLTPYTLDRMARLGATFGVTVYPPEIAASSPTESDLDI